MFHLHVGYLSKAKGGLTSKNFEYIARLGRFRSKGDLVREVMHLHMPVWAPVGREEMYWQEADLGSSRANARSAYTIEASLPKALNHRAQRNLAIEFAHKISDLCCETFTPFASVPISLALHEGHGRNPHLHMLVSTSVHDRIERSPALWFMRYNPVKPANGGARRSRFMAKLKWLVQVRQAWETMANKALVMAGLQPTLDHRSHKDRGLTRKPTEHLGPSASHLLRQNRPAPRVQRFLAIQQENAAFDELNERIEKTKKQLLALEKQGEADRHARLVWQNNNERFWQTVLVGHPLSTHVTPNNNSFTVLIMDGHDGRKDPALNTQTFFELGNKIRNSLPPHWDLKRNAQGLWLLRPNVDQIIRVDRSIVVSDAVDADAIEVILQVSKLLKFVSGVVHVKESLFEVVKARIDDMKINWAVRIAAESRSPISHLTALKTRRP